MIYVDGESRKGTQGSPTRHTTHFLSAGLVEAMGAAAAATAQVGAADSQGGIDDTRGIQNVGVGTKRKEDPSSSNPRKKQKTSVS